MGDEVKVEGLGDMVAEVKSDVIPITAAKVPGKKVAKGIKGLWLAAEHRVAVPVYVYQSTESGELVLVLADPVDEEKLEVLDLAELKIDAEFTVPDREQLERYRERAGRWNEEAQSILINRGLVRKQLLRHHLVAITIADSETGEVFVLEREGDGARAGLSGECERKLNKLHPTVLDTLILKFERVANLLY